MKAINKRPLTAIVVGGSLSMLMYFVGCSNAVDSSTWSVQTKDEIATTLLVSNQPIEQWQTEDNNTLPLVPPSNPRGGENDGDIPNKPRRSQRPLPIPCLGLTPEQIMQIRQFQAELDSADRAVLMGIQVQLDELRQRERQVWENYRQATAIQREQLAQLYRQFRSQVDSIRRLIREGALSRDEARAILRQLSQDFMAARRALIDSTVEARAELRAALDQIAQERKALYDSVQSLLDANYQQFLRKVASILTPEQLEIWLRWLNGEDPCKGRGNGRRG